MKLKHFLARLFLRTIGRSSNGVRLCLDTGLTSGKTVDYVYRNQPAGCCGVGRFIDRRFLADPGWEAVRLRRRNLEDLLLRAVASLRQRGSKVVMLDIASGPASYVIAVAQAAGGDDLSARCCDHDERWLREGQAEADARGLRQVRFQTGDAFDREALLALSPRPNIAIASGFYDWITEDEDVKRSLAILFETLEPGGFLALTNQVSHPDLEFVSAVFTDFHRQPLHMKMRPVAQIRQWLEQGGFVHEETLLDPRGHYSVTLASKP